MVDISEIKDWQPHTHTHTHTHTNLPHVSNMSQQTTFVALRNASKYIKNGGVLVTSRLGRGGLVQFVVTILNCFTHSSSFPRCVYQLFNIFASPPSTPSSITKI